jgi:hypothetical protein
MYVYELDTDTAVDVGVDVNIDMTMDMYDYRIGE